MVSSFLSGKLDKWALENYKLKWWLMIKLQGQFSTECKKNGPLKGSIWFKDEILIELNPRTKKLHGNNAILRKNCLYSFLGLQIPRHAWKLWTWCGKIALFLPWTSKLKAWLTCSTWNAQNIQEISHRLQISKQTPRKLWAWDVGKMACFFHGQQEDRTKKLFIPIFWE